jgi:acyl-CoA dehydrogenase
LINCCGGASAHTEIVGLQTFVDECNNLATRHAARFNPSVWQIERAAKDKGFQENGAGLKTYITRSVMDFTIPKELQDLQAKVRAFIQQEVIPLESDPRCTAHGPTEELRCELIAKARNAGLLSSHVSQEFGGLGLNHFAKAVVFEEAGYSPLGPVALNIAAPDEGNMHLLEEVATTAQKERWLRPLAAGEIRSCFCMTEPAPGAGSDPGMLMTTARNDGSDYIINGTKWFITGADGAGFAIIMAKLDSGEGTMFLADMNTPGITIERTMHALDSCFPGGHAVVRFENVRIPAENILGESGQGFRYAQVRLSPARLTHCMRWLGAARRAHDVASEYARRRHAFGQPLGAHEGVGFMLADNEMDLHVTRLAIYHCAWVLDQGVLGKHESSIAKVVSSEAIWRVVDRCVQVLGGQGVTHETVVARIFADVRAFRVYDGPSEVHRWSIARRILRGPKRA